MLDWEDDSPQPRYAICRAGFATVAIGLSLLAMSAGVGLARMFSPSPDLERLIGSSLWKWAVDAPITWLTLLGSYILWAGWTDVYWRRKAGLLLVLNSIDGVQWTLGHANDLGLELGAVGHPWLRYQVGSLFNWIEFALAARLAYTLTERLGGADPALRHKARVFCYCGIIVWGLTFFHMTAWHRGWPLMHRQPRVLGVFLILGTDVLTLLALLNIIPICVSACRLCSRAIAQSPFEEDQGLDLLKSRSETWEDENHWKSPDKW